MMATLSLAMLPKPAAADETLVSREARYFWNKAKTELYADFSFRDLVNSALLEKLSRGLPTTIVFTGLVYRQGANEPVSSTLQSCKVTWHLWEEMYRVELTRPNRRAPTRYWTPTISGVLRRCIEVRGLLIADRSQVEPGKAVQLRGKVQINPVSDELLKKIKRWISRPSRTSTATPGSALFSTFTGLFMQRIGDAERSVDVQTKLGVPKTVDGGDS